jgi:hypothetical protein
MHREPKWIPADTCICSRLPRTVLDRETAGTKRPSWRGAGARRGMGKGNLTPLAGSAGPDSWGMVPLLSSWFHVPWNLEDASGLVPHGFPFCFASMATPYRYFFNYRVLTSPRLDFVAYFCRGMLRLTWRSFACLCPCSVSCILCTPSVCSYARVVRIVFCTQPGRRRVACRDNSSAPPYMLLHHRALYRPGQPGLPPLAGL